MKDKSFTVKYARTDTGAIQVFILKDGKYLETLTVFQDLTTWIDLDERNTAPVHVFPPDALHRIWSKEVCSACGWESKPFEGTPVGFGGTLNCPECAKAKRNPQLEGCYGNVHAVALDWKTKQPLKLESTKK